MPIAMHGIYPLLVPSGSSSSPLNKTIIIAGGGYAKTLRPSNAFQTVTLA